MGIYMPPCAGAFIYACGCSILLTCVVPVSLSLSCSPSLALPPFPSLFNYALNLCGVLQTTQGRRERTVLYVGVGEEWTAETEKEKGRVRDGE